MDFVDENNAAGAFAEFIFCVDKNQAFFGCHLGAAGEELARILLHHCVVFLAYQTLGDDFLARDILVVALGSFGGGGNDGLGEALVLAHPVGKLHAA